MSKINESRHPETGSRRSRVLVVDDSALMRQLLTQILESSNDMKVVGTARDPYDAWEKIHELEPNVITLDVEMPRMDGLEFLRKLMIARPTPVVMVSSLTEEGCTTTLRALELGAVDYVSKPKLDIRSGTMGLAQEIIEKVRVASRARPQGWSVRQKESDSRIPGLLQSTHRLVVVGASTGGTEAVAKMLRDLPADSPGMVIVQHMPSDFTCRFAERLDGVSRMCVREAKHGDRVLPGLALIAPGGRHLEVVRRGASIETHVKDGPAVNRFRPSVDVLFHSCAREVGKHAVGIILTGMGDDGAKGIRAMYDAGACTIAQDEASCVVFGMPKSAIKTGGVQHVLSLNHITKMICCNETLGAT